MSDGGGGVGYGWFLFASFAISLSFTFSLFIEKFKEKLNDNIVYTYILFI